MGDLSAHYKFLTAMIDGGLKQLAVMGTMHEVGYCVNDNVKVYQKIIQKYTTSTECCKGTKSLLYITYC